jgi:hypothetical protein
MTVSEHKKYFNRPRGYFHITSHRGGLIFIVKYVLTFFVNYLITLYKQNVVHVPKMARDKLSKYVVYSLHRKITAQNISFLPIFTSLFEKSTLFACNALKLWRTQAKYINEVNYLLYSYTAGSGRVFPSAA